MDYSFPHYLAAKKTIDDRALNLRVWKTLENELELIQRTRPVTILEAGAGTGTMITRILDKGVLFNGTYHALDAVAENINAAGISLENWADEHGWKKEPVSNGLNLYRDQNAVQINLQAIDVFDFLDKRKPQQTWDCVIANAFLDLFDSSQIVHELGRCIKPGGLAYFTINFDGVTEFEPVANREFEERIIGAYHRTMDDRMINNKRSGDSQAGRHLFQLFQREGFEILEAGSSDWVVYGRKGNYPADEAYFLHHMIHFFEESLQNSPVLSSDELAAWTAGRHAQVERGELVYIAHQMDFLARAPKRR
jgi:SAM-dependent methyltransferase